MSASTNKTPSPDSWIADEPPRVCHSTACCISVSSRCSGSSSAGGTWACRRVSRCRREEPPAPSHPVCARSSFASRHRRQTLWGRRSEAASMRSIPAM
eukprot:scaffold16579_cov130-Isochrysis_galbana.AAC.1